jgi:regulator of sigma E protease
LALFIYCGLYAFSGKQVMTPEIGQVTPNSPAERAGLMKGDVILSIGGKTIESWSEIRKVVETSEEQPLEITVKRGEKFFTVTVVPEQSTISDIFGQEVQTSLIGIVSANNIKTLELSPTQAIKEGFIQTWKIIELICLTVMKLFQRVIPLKTIGGPILIAQMTGELAQESLAYLFPFMAVISVNLAILNLLPVPILDGGLILFLFIELITRKPMSVKKREWATKVGLFLLITLMVVVIYNDVTRLFE